MSKQWTICFFFLTSLLAQPAFADDYNLVKYSDFIVRGRLHTQTKTVKRPHSDREYPVPFRLEITQVFKEYTEEPKEIEITDTYYDECHTLDSLALTKKFQELDGKEVMVFLHRIPSAEYKTVDTNAKKIAPEYYLAYSDVLHVCSPSPNSLQLYSSSVSQTVQLCLHPTPVPTPNWNKVISNANFSFLDTAIQRADNDMDIGPSREGTKVSIPEKVKLVLQDEAKSDFKDVLGKMADELSDEMKNPDFKNDVFIESELPNPQDTYGPVYLIKALNGLEIYAMMNRTSNTWSSWGYSLVLYDSKTNRVSAKPTWICGKWLENLDEDMRMFEGDRSLARPFISFDDINSDGQNALVVEERVHNGTMLNGCLYHYFFIEKDLSLKEILGLEARLLNIDDEDYWFFRKITARKKNEITVDVTMEKLNEGPMPIGSMILKSSGNDTSFKLVHKEVTNKKYEFLLYPSNDDDYFQY